MLLRLLNGDILVGRFGMLTLCRFIKLVVLGQVLSMIRGNKNVKEGRIIEEKR